ncbi:MAG: hypothetical protein ACK5YM_07805, partial [Pseudomonadota bacterium]
MSTTPTAPTAAAAATAGHSIAELRTQLQALEARRAGGTVAQAEYQRERNRLERALADQVLADPGAAALSGA